MTDYRIILPAPMVRALLDGRKTMTRLLAWGRDLGHCAKCGVFHPATKLDGCVYWPHKPTIWQKVRPGDRLWVRETWKPHSIYAAIKPGHIPKSRVFFHADDHYAPSNTPWRPSIHMPRWASRLTLVVTETKLERLQEISHADMRAEGLQAWESTLAAERCMNPRRSFGNLWNTLHKPGDLWEDNPEVVAMGGTVHNVNIDDMEQAA